MDFFAHQEAARRRTWWLVVLFFAALAGIIATMYIAAVLLHQVVMAEATSATTYGSPEPVLTPAPFNPELFLGVAAFASIVVLAGTTYKLSQLRQGGETVALMLGGERLNPQSTQFHERRLLNVVEEMALASGVSVPPVFVMRGQKGINAFAAGYSINDAVIGVTEGTLRGLKREELQGVIAHEFSHILNGDMRLNIRLIGILHGLLLLAIIGRVLVRVSGSGRRSSGGKKGGGAVIVIAGLVLMVVGYAGYFFGGLIKRAVSRQREFLADASAVQFTRSTDGLCGALKKIGGLASGATVRSEHAEEVSHMFFADGINRLFGAGSLFATHPPLKKRITLLDPTFDGEFPIVTEDSLYLEAREADVKAAKPEPEGGGGDFIKRSVLTGGAMAGGMGQDILMQAGVLDAASVQEVAEAMRDVPETLRQQLREPLGAQAFVFALLIRRGEEESVDAWTWIPAAFIDPVSRILEQLSALPRRRYLMLLETAIPALRTLSKEQGTRFMDIMTRIIDTDQRIDLYEFAVSEIVRAGLRETLGVAVSRFKAGRLAGVAGEASLLISLMARVGQADMEAAGKAFARAVEPLGDAGLVFRPEDALQLQAARGALDALLAAAMPVRKQVLEAALRCLLQDGKATDDEFELFRAFAASMEVPIPPGWERNAGEKADPNASR